MPANTTPIFPISQRVGQASLTVANFAKSGATAFGANGTSPTFATVLAAGTNGTRIDQIKVRSLGLNAAGVLRLFVNDGTNNYLVHETTLNSVGTAGTAVTVSTQSISGNAFVTPSAHGLSLGQTVVFTSLSTLTAVSLNTSYIVTSVPTTTSFTLSTLTGTAVTVSSSVTGATASLTPYTNLETSAQTDYDITISKNTTETAAPIPYLPNGYSLRATVGTIGAAPFNMGWQVTAFGADY